MKNALFLLLLLHLCGCAGLKQARQRRQVAKARAVLACYEHETPASQQLSDLLAANPALEGTTVRIVKERDTVRIAPATAAVSLPAVSTTASDNALIDSLLNSAGKQLQRKDSATFAARLRAELSRRPRLSRDTITRVIGPLTLRLWTDQHGRPQAVVVKAAQAVAYDKTVTETKAPDLPKPDIGFFPRLWLFIQDAATLIVLLITGGVVVVIVAMVRRPKQAQV